LVLDDTSFDNTADITKVNIFVIHSASNGAIEYVDNIVAAPEPSTYALFGLGLFGLIGTGLRKYRKNKAA